LDYLNPFSVSNVFMYGIKSVKMPVTRWKSRRERFIKASIRNPTMENANQLRTRDLEEIGIIEDLRVGNHK
jgi:hypothetical protein